MIFFYQVWFQKGKKSSMSQNESQKTPPMLEIQWPETVFCPKWKFLMYYRFDCHQIQTCLFSLFLKLSNQSKHCTAEMSSNNSRFKPIYGWLRLFFAFFLPPCVFVKRLPTSSPASRKPTGLHTPEITQNITLVSKQTLKHWSLVPIAEHIGQRNWYKRNIGDRRNILESVLEVIGYFVRPRFNSSSDIKGNPNKADR